MTILGLNPLNQGRWLFALGDAGGALVVVALSPVQRPLHYWLDVRPAASN